MELTAELTPAQTAFLESSISGFNPRDWRVELAGQAASTRRFFRVWRGGESYILMEWDSRDEDWPRFIDIAAFVSSASPVEFLPKIYASDPALGLILEEDLGAVTLKKFCAGNAGGAGAAEAKYREAIDMMSAWHGLCARGAPAGLRLMDAEVFMWESGYFAEHCVGGHCGKAGLLSAAWEEERGRMAAAADGLPKAFMHRDFQSENIMVQGARIRFVDYQGARLGPPCYDLASLLFDPYVDLGFGMIEGLLDYYYLSNAPAPDCRRDFYVCAAQRLMQALGAYGNLSINKGKPHYARFIRPALERLSYVMKFLPDYPVLAGVVGECLGV